MIGFVRNVFGGVLTVIDLAVRSEAMGRAYAANAAQSSWLDRQEEASEVLEPRPFVCNTRAAAPVADPADSLLRYNDIECDVCATEHADFPGAPIACGTAGCPNASHPSAPGLGGLVERTTPEEATPTASSGASTSITSGGGTASVGNQPLPGAVATPGAGQPLSQVLLSAAGFASAGGAPVWICQAVMDLADQFRADELDAL